MLTILHADDDIEIRERFARMCKRGGYNVISAEDGEAAWKLLCGASTLPDIIVSDFDMPKMTGGQLLRKVRDHEEFRGIPFTLLTATKQNFDGEALMDVCARHRAHHVHKGKWDGDLESLLKPLIG